MTQSVTASYISISVWGKNNDGATSLGSARFLLSELAVWEGQDVDISIRLNKERNMILANSLSPGSGKLGSLSGSGASKSNPSPSTAIKSPIQKSPSEARNVQTSNQNTSTTIRGLGGPRGAEKSDSTSSLDSTEVLESHGVGVSAASAALGSSGGASGGSGSSASSTANTPQNSHASLPQFATLKVHIRIERQKRKVSEADFEKLRVIGRGTFGKVFQVRKKDTGRIYAMKVLKKDHVVKNNAVKHTMSENHVLKNINHPFIVNLKYAFQTTSHLYMVIDYLNGGELFYHLTHDDYFPEPRAKLYAAEVVSALGYLHEHHILYRDLKPENLILDMHGHVCLVDFGLCKVGWQPNTQTHTFCGSAEYLSPELLRGKGYGKEVDWWALGVLIYEMLSGLPPFWDEDEEYMQKKIISAPLKLHKYFSAEAKDFIRQLLNRDPEQRLGSGNNGTERIKAHPWFSDIDWVALERRELVPTFVPHLKNEQDLPYVEPDVLSELPALSLTNTSFNLDSDLFAGFSYDSEMIHAHMLNHASSSAHTPLSSSVSRRGAANNRRGDGARRSRADSNYSDSDSDLDNSGTPSGPGISSSNNSSSKNPAAPGSGRLRRVAPTSSSASSVQTDSGLIFDLEDSD